MIIRLLSYFLTLLSHFIHFFFPNFFLNLQYLWDQIYLRSTFLQALFSYRFGIHTPPPHHHHISSISHLNHPSDHSHHLSNIFHLCKISNICVDVHTTVTKDGYHLVLHHCYNKAKDIDDSCDFHHHQQQRRPPVLLVHGLMQDAESFLCSGPTSIVTTLIEAGYDVWIGNNRGTKYSSTHIHYHQKNEEYWNYCIDDLAIYDVPAMINYVLDRTNYQQLAYIGFSQGSTQGFASLYSYQKLHTKISIFIALSPALKSTGLQSSWLQSLFHTFPHIIFDLFGRYDMLSCTEYYRQLLSKSFFAQIVRYAMKLLFNWSCQNISIDRQIELFQYCYSPSSVKCVNHWFQIIQHGSFRCYNYEIEKKKLITLKPMKTINYDCNRTIQCPIAIFYGGEDTLIVNTIHEVLQDINDSIKYLYCEPSYEHLDLIWADCAHIKIFPKIINQLEIYHPR